MVKFKVNKTMLLLSITLFNKPTAHNKERMLKIKNLQEKSIWIHIIIKLTCWQKTGFMEIQPRSNIKCNFLNDQRNST